MTIHPIDIIRHKRDSLTLTDAEIETFVRAVVDRTISDAQIGAFLMAVWLRGLNAQELATLTRAMRFSGEVFDSSPLNAFAVDKHSTGGVGDKTSLLIAPIVAAAGFTAPHKLAVPMISGRSLGHTGGTLDKLETIPGFRTQLSLKEFADVIAQCGASIVGQTPSLVPADRILYALRDHTGTVESPNLICASIMSKKLAAGLNGLVLDVKTGSGAFMSRYEDSQHLARLMVATGEAAGTRTAALLTSMDEPLGRFSGNWIEVWECVDILKGIRHPMSADLIELSNILAGWMLFLGDCVDSPETGAALADEMLQSGAAYQSWLAMVKLQGGDTSTFDDPAAHHKPTATRILTADRSGYLAGMDCAEVGWAVQRLGAGRTRPGDPVSAHAGIEMHAKLGTWIEAGQPLVTLFSEDAALLDEPASMLRSTLLLLDTPSIRQPLIREIITAPAKN
ncbi:thymidine phosphorylase [Granulicella arctica]|uniref:thymidine phosphorylase n=1 Tax=Granulicella arctica TaxID=940613 RepID=A0A7Y9PI03_9BACT|nr:thymidine phosphorylase [Granulicella arctica]NYF79473.1 pyrimidine-nucleoside phosphorylase [Granulicella arctica]